MQTSTVTVTFTSGAIRSWPGKWDDAVERMQTILAHHADEIASVVVTPDQPDPRATATEDESGASR